MVLDTISEKGLKAAEEAWTKDSTQYLTMSLFAAIAEMSRAVQPNIPSDADRTRVLKESLLDIGSKLQIKLLSSLAEQLEVVQLANFLPIVRYVEGYFAQGSVKVR